MSTTPVVPTPAVTAAVANVASHPLIYLIVIALLVYGGVVGVEDLMAKHDAKVAATQLQKEGVDTATTATLLAQLQKQQTDDEMRDAAAQATIQTLVKQMATSRAQTKQQVATDATLDAQSAASRLVARTKTTPADAVANGDAVTLSLPLTRIVVSDLDELPQAQSDVTNLQGQLTATKTQLTDAQSQLGITTQTITADKAELVQTVKADDAACKVQVDAQAAKDRKRALWLTILAAVAGAVAGRAL